MTQILQRDLQFPDVTRADVALITVSQWKINTSDRLGQLSARLESDEWPRGLLSVSLFQSTDNRTMLNYAQWASEEAYYEFERKKQARGSRHSGDSGVWSARGESTPYRLYRSRVRNDAPNPGCLVLVEVEFTGSDEARQRRWVDTVLDALDSEIDHPTGGIAGHFHLSVDGTRVINCALWVDEEAHRQAMEASGQGTVIRGPKWLLVRDFLGMKSSQVTRYHLIRSDSAQKSVTKDAA